MLIRYHVSRCIFKSTEHLRIEFDISTIKWIQKTKNQKKARESNKVFNENQEYPKEWFHKYQIKWFNATSMQIEIQCNFCIVSRKELKKQKLWYSKKSTFKLYGQKLVWESSAHDESWFKAIHKLYN